MNIVDYNISDLISAEYNPRYINGSDFKALKDSLKRFEAVEPIIVNTHKDRKN